MYQGATQIDGSRRNRIVVVSGGPSSASGLRAPRALAALAADKVARKSRRFCLICIESLLWYREPAGPPGLIHPPAFTHAFSSRLSSLRKRQSVPSAMILLGLVLIMATSYMRNA